MNKEVESEVGSSGLRKFKSWCETVVWTKSWKVKLDQGSEGSRHKVKFWHKQSDRKWSFTKRIMPACFGFTWWWGFVVALVISTGDVIRSQIQTDMMISRGAFPSVRSVNTIETMVTWLACETYYDYWHLMLAQRLILHFLNISLLHSRFVTAYECILGMKVHCFLPTFHSSKIKYIPWQEISTFENMEME